MENYPVLQKGKFDIKFSEAVSSFESATRKIPIKKILYKTLFRGKGLEFDTYKNVEQTDDASIIDWKASLRANELLAKKYIEEREINFYFLVDVSNSMLFGSGAKLKAEYSSEVVAALSHLILGTRDRAGLIMFSDKIVKVLPSSNGKNQFPIIIQLLNNPNFYGGGFNMQNLVKFIIENVKTQHNVFFLISDFLALKKEDPKSLLLLTTRFEMVALVIRDIFDESLPKTNLQFAISDPNSSEQMILDLNLASQKYKESVMFQKILMKEIFKKSKVDMIELSTSKSFVVPLVSFLRQRTLLRWSI